MKNTLRLLALILPMAATPLFGADAPAASGPYSLLKTIDLPTAATSWDYLTVDSDSHRLYVSNGNSVIAIDTEKDAVAGQVDETTGVHGFAVAPKLGRGYSSNGRSNNVSVVDLKTLKTVSKVDTGQNPDWIMFEPTQGEIYTFNGRSNDSTVFNAETGKVVATIPLGGKPETAMADPKTGRIYDNIEDTNELVAIDIKTHTVAERWPIAPGKAASGLAIDLAHQRVFLGCGDTNTMVMLDYTKGKVVASVPIGAGVDACSFDPGTQFAFSSCGGAGTVTIAHEDAPDKLTVVQTLATARGARTMTIDTATHKIYLAAVNYAGAAPASGARGRQAAAPGSFHILVYGMEAPARK